MSLTTTFSSAVKLVAGTCDDPHATLGVHRDPSGGWVYRLWRPGATQVYAEIKGEIVELSPIDPGGLFQLEVAEALSPQHIRVYHEDGRLCHDPYLFWPTLGELDLHLFGRGVHYELHRVMGARPMEHQGVHGTAFAVWAPNAQRVSLLADFNHWDGRQYPMRSLGGSGVWELFVPGMGAGEAYKFELLTGDGNLRVKADPYGKASELRPKTASIVVEGEGYQWHDEQWLQQRAARKEEAQPLNVYEVHLGSWKQKDGEFLNYRELAQQLAEYCRQMGFTHVELAPVMEHPLDESWGYQVSGYYAVTSRFGTPEDFQYFVDHLHQAGIGVLLDWVPGHFPMDDFALARFDGTALYEHQDWRQGYHPHWNTHVFNYGRNEVSNFLISSALYWLTVMHIDGLRVDAVASMLYLDYGREEGDWIPNQYGGKENLEAIEFLKHLNAVVHEQSPGTLMIAEESTSFTGVTHSLDVGGLGFDLKWNMGWMNDSLTYFCVDPLYRSHHHNQLTFGLIYAFSERFCLSLSHDEVVHGKGSLLSKMPGDPWQQFANLRLLLSYMMCQPGKKLLFMSGEFGQWDEWDCKHSIQWHLLDFPTHQGLHQMVRDLNHFYLEHPALWEQDFSHQGFEWVDLADRDHSVISYKRKSSRGDLLCVHNFTPAFHADYNIYCGPVRSIREVFNTDLKSYGGSGKEHLPVELLNGAYGEVVGFKCSLAPLSTTIFSVE